MDGLRVSTLIYRTGSDGGEKGPTGFLPAGKKLHIAYTDGYLRRHGAVDVSAIAMADNGYMALEAWEELTPKLSKGTRKLPTI